MKSRSLLPLVILVAGVVSARAVTIGLFEYALNHDGTVTNPTLGDPLPPWVSIAGFDTATGLGVVQVQVSGVGSHSVGMFVDHEIDQAINTFFNEVGSASGAPPSGLTWEIDEPGYVFGDIYDNFAWSSLDNSVGSVDPDDASMALAWDFFLNSGETALVSMRVSDVAPNAGFYLRHTDPDSAASIYFSSALRISGGGGAVPDGGSSLALLGLALVGSAVFRRLR